MDKNCLHGKKILITAGPTWVPIDDVRVISNISSGVMGNFLVQEALRYGMKVDIFLGPVGYPGFDKNVNIQRFTFFDELYTLTQIVLKKKKYDYILHCAAVSDYKTSAIKGKISSTREELVVRLTRTPKIIDMMRRLNPDSFLVMFKLEAHVSDSILLKRACEAMKKAHADLVVANTYQGKTHRSFVLGADKVLVKTRSKKELAQNLFKILSCVQHCQENV